MTSPSLSWKAWPTCHPVVIRALKAGIRQTPPSKLDLIAWHLLGLHLPWNALCCPDYAQAATQELLRAMQIAPAIQLAMQYFNAQCSCTTWSSNCTWLAAQCPPTDRWTVLNSKWAAQSQCSLRLTCPFAQNLMMFTSSDHIARAHPGLHGCTIFR